MGKTWIFMSQQNVRRLLLVLMVSLLTMGTAFQANAVQANPNPIAETQPDGTPITLLLKGDEWFHWYEDLNGYTIVEDGGTYFYATLDNAGNLAPTAVPVGSIDPAAAGIAPKVLPPEEQIVNQVAAATQSMSPPFGAPEPVPASGTVDNIIILTRFSDHGGRTLPTNGNFDTLLNAVGGDPTYAPTGSVRDVYLESSYGSFTLDSTVIGWVTLPNTEAYYANGVSGLGGSKVGEMLVDALNLADPLIDFNLFDSDTDGFVDAIGFIHSGYGAETGGTDPDGAVAADRIWSHKSVISAWTSAEGEKVSTYHINPSLAGNSGGNITTIGVVCHETGHFFGLPDLYDYGDGSGIGSWGMMANSWGFSGNGSRPPLFSAWSKIELGWVTPTVITTDGAYALAQAATNNAYYRINKGFPANEYLLIENRQPAGIESTIPQGGLAIFHIDDNAPHNNRGYPGQAGWPTNGNHYRVALLQADGYYDLELNLNRGDSGDTYHGGGVSALTTTSTPNTDVYQSGTVYDSGVSITGIAASSANMGFTVGLGDDMQVQGQSLVSSTGELGGPFSPSSSDYDVTNLGVSLFNWDVTLDVAWMSATLTSGTVGAASSQAITLSINSGANALAEGTHIGTATFQNTGNLFEQDVTFSLEVTEPKFDIFVFNLDTDPGWSTTGGWAYGTPLGGGTHNGDPSSGFSGTKVYGYNLSGDYTDSLAPQYLMTATLDFSASSNVEFEFQRWLGVENQPWDNASIEVHNNNGSGWVEVWANEGDVISEFSWSLQTYDISAVADGESNVQVRWIMGDTDTSITYPGWNIDDVRFRGTPNGPAENSLTEAWVDFAHTGSALGTSGSPLKTIADAVTALVDNGTGTMKIKGNTGDSESSETPTITKPMTIDADSGTIKIGTL